LKPDGQIGLVKFRAEDENLPIKPEHKMSKAQINKELNANGFKLVREYDGLPWQHLMFFWEGGGWGGGACAGKVGGPFGPCFSAASFLGC
jgi:hypothetical protein